MGDLVKDSSLSAADQFDIGRFQAFLQTRSFARTLRYTHSTASTNADALDYLQHHSGTPGPHGMAILAECQTAGRGRRGRTWHSPAQGNIYSSVIVVPPLGVNRPESWLSWVPLLSALAVADCLSSHAGCGVSVKWPNDLLVGDKKLGGILCEQTSTSDKALAIIIGIGLNINSTLDKLPEELRASATSLSAECGRTLDRVAILADLFFRLEQRMDHLCLSGATTMMDEFTQRCSTIGKKVRVALEDQGDVQGIAESIGPDGCLCLRVGSEAGSASVGSVLEIRSAEVLHLRG